MTPSDYKSGSLRADSSVNSTISVNIDGGVANADRMDNLEQVAPVSYTHLTLPTILLV